MSDIEVCALCGHAAVGTDECGLAGVWDDGETVYLCHADDHSCYVRWTVWGER